MAFFSRHRKIFQSCPSGDSMWRTAKFPEKPKRYALSARENHRTRLMRGVFESPFVRTTLGILSNKVAWRAAVD